MSAMEWLCRIIDVNPRQFSRAENLILEAELFSRLCDEFHVMFKAQFKDYFRLMKFNAEMEDTVIEASFIRCIINDILSTQDYTVSGIARYTQIPEEIIDDLVRGNHTYPTLSLPRKIIEIHRSVRSPLYRDVLMKIIKKDSMTIP